MSCLHSSEGENRQREAGSQTHHRPVGRHQDAGRKAANATSHMSTEKRGWDRGGVSTGGRSEKERLDVQLDHIGSKGRYLWADLLLPVNPGHRRNHSQLGEELPSVSSY